METPDRRTCSQCGRTKPIDAFPHRSDGWRRLQCRVCFNLARRLKAHTPEAKARSADYRADPECRACARARSRRYYRRHRDEILTATRTPWAKVRHYLAQTHYELRHTTDPARIARLEALIADLERERARMRLDRDLCQSPRGRKAS